MIGNDTNRTPPPLSAAIDALLAHERVVMPQPEIVRARALARAREALRAADEVAFTPRKVSSPVRRLLFAAAAGVAFMAGAAAAYQRLWRPEPTPPASVVEPPRPRHALLAPPAAELAPEPPPVPDEVAPIAPAVSAVSPRAARSSHRIRLAGRNEDGQKELLLLVEARRADARGDFLSALTVLAEHERSYPAGRLSEEREVLHVKALVGLGRGAEARQVAANFRRQFPRSVLRHKIEDMLTTLQ
jgi:hypothetical protein